MRINYKHILCCLLALVLVACGGKKNSASTPLAESQTVTHPPFCADTAFRFVEEQVNFGPRVPNTVAHSQCADYLEEKLASYGATVYTQQANLVAFDGTLLHAKNIIASYNPAQRKRILLMAHWDCRPFSDSETDATLRTKPVLGADDGASGVGVLLEMARIFSLQLPTIGVDIVLFDAEDYGNPAGGDTESWCLGSQYWATNPHQVNYRARYGILLDMVGGKEAKFYQEGNSMLYAPNFVEKVWKTAASLGYDDVFVNKKQGYITDDHYFVNEILGVPSIDIINFSENGFPEHWHTQHDDMSNISRSTLMAVGQTLLKVVYEEK